uniref:BHLH domain-containing protein n=1 Tax=Macrostomum lignano TaxID=282301 RepID=A0A1I8HYW5_9PLAT
MTSRTNLRQQLLKQQPQPATSAVQNLIVTRAPVSIAASSLQNGGQAAWQQPQSRGGVLTIVKQSPQEETSPLSPNSTASVSDPQNAMEEVDIDFIDPTFGQLSSTVPTHSGHLAGFGAPSADDGASTGSFGLGGGGGAGASGGSGGFKPSTSAPASTQLFLAMNQQLGGAGGGAAAAGVVGFSIGGGQAADDDKTVSLRDRYKKESHNRIERKRRENINYQISELGECIPKAWFRESELKKNKGNILKASVDYIKEMQAANAQLKERLAACSLRESKLEQLYKALVARIQDMERVMREAGVQYRANSFDEGIIRELLGFLADSGARSAEPPMRSAGWLMLLLGCSFQLLSLLCLARWREPPLAAAGPPELPGGPDGPRLTRRLLQLRGVFVEPAGDSALSRALASTGLPSSVDLRLAKIPPVAGKRRVLTAHSGEELRREVNLGLRSMWAAYATWAEVPEFEPRLAAALEAFGCRLALLPCATVPGMAAYCTERGFRRGWAGLLVTHPDSTGLQDVAAAFRPSADPSVVLARLSTRVSGLLAAWPPSGRSTAAAAGECGLLAELPGWPPAPPLMLAALSVEFQDRLRFWHRRLNDSTGSMRLVLLTPEQRLSLAPADCGTPAALRLLLASVAPDAWQAGLAAAALLNFGLLPLPLLLPGTALPARCLAAVRMAA